MRIILLAFIAIFTLSHCNDNSNAQSNPSNTNPGTFEVTINGTLWKAQNSTFNHTYSNDAVTGEQLILKGTGTDGRSVVISVNSITPKTYQFDLGNGINDCVVSLSIPGKPTPIPSKATVTITSHNVAAKMVSGTFSFETDNQEYVGTSGVFTGVVYKIQ